MAQVTFTRAVPPAATPLPPVPRMPVGGPACGAGPVLPNARFSRMPDHVRAQHAYCIEAGKVLDMDTHEVVVVDAGNAVRLWRAMKREQGVDGEQALDAAWQALHGGTRMTASFAVAAVDAAMLARIGVDLSKGMPGLQGVRYVARAYVKGNVLIFKGRPGLRSVLNAPRYGLTHPKVVQFGLGSVNAASKLRNGGILSIVLVSVVNVVDYLIRDSATLSQLIGNMATDLAIVAASTGLAIGAIKVAVGMNLLLAGAALGPLVIGVAVGVLASYGLSKLDEHLGVREFITDMIDWTLAAGSPDRCTLLTPEILEGQRRSYFEDRARQSQSTVMRARYRGF